MLKWFVLVSCAAAFVLGLNPVVTELPEPPTPPSPNTTIASTQLQLFVKEIATSQKMVQNFQTNLVRLQKQPKGMHTSNTKV